LDSVTMRVRIKSVKKRWKSAIAGGTCLGPDSFGIRKEEGEVAQVTEIPCSLHYPCHPFHCQT
jgi:hypothetical protein